MDNDGGFGPGDNDSSGFGSGNPGVGPPGSGFGGDPGVPDASGFDVVGLPPVSMTSTSTGSPSPSFGGESMDDLGMMFADPNNSGMSQGFSNDASNTAIPQDTMFSKMSRMALNMAMSRMGVPGMASTVANTGFNMSQASSKQGMDNAAVQGLMGMVTGMMGIPGLGINAMNGVMNAMGIPGTTGHNSGEVGSNSSVNGMNGENILGGLASLYGYNRSNNAANEQINSLSGMYGQDSPYAQMLRQQLNRRDAAGGRRSQYGPREVELQAKLAQMAGGNANAIGNLRQGQNQMRAQGLAQLIQFMNKSGATQGISNGIQGLFNPNDGQQQFNQDYGPAIDPYGAGSGWGQDTFSGMGQQPDYSMFGG